MRAEEIGTSGHQEAKPTMETRSIGKQHVLAPEFRTPEYAFQVAQKLLHKAATKLRMLNCGLAGLGQASGS
jgi:DNA polymerase-4